MIGKVESYDAKKGYGFIRGDDGKRYFVPYVNVKTASGSLMAGYTVDFNTGRRTAMPKQGENNMIVDGYRNENEYSVPSGNRLRKERQAYEEAEREEKRNG